MRNYLFVFLFTEVLLWVNSPCFAQKYVLVWNDEFNKPGLPDSTKWGFETGLVRNNELQYYTNKRYENARIEDTVLIIEARKELFNGSNYTAASLKSKGIGDWLYGKIDIRAKVPTGKGTWPALWMMPTYSEYGGWPKSGEIDIMEYIGVDPEKLHYTCHFEGTNGSGHQSSGFTTSTLSKPYNQFIKFTLVWTPEKLEWFANDVKFHEYKKTSDDYRIWPFNHEFYLILNLAYGGSWGGSAGVDDTKLPHKFLIDYVRVYQLQETPGPFILNIPARLGGNVEVSPKLDFYPENTEITIRSTAEKGFTFKAWKHWSSANPFTFRINKNTYIEPLFYNENELITNRTFDKNWMPWEFYVSNSQTASYLAAVENGVFVVNITKSPGIDWQLGFQETGLSMRKGNYKLTFNAYATQQKQLLITVSKNYPDWSEHLNKKLSVSTVNTKYELILTMPKDDDNVRLYFGLGNFSGKFNIDNVSLERLTDSSTPAIKTRNGLEKEIAVFPNPARNKFNVRVSDELLNDNAEILVFDIDGKIISRKRLNKTETQFDSNEFANGIYFLKLNSIHTKFETQLIISK